MKPLSPLSRLVTVSNGIGGGRRLSGEKFPAVIVALVALIMLVSRILGIDLPEDLSEDKLGEALLALWALAWAFVSWRARERADR